MSTKVCFYCQKPGDLRPYGPRASMICFACMKADPKRERQAGIQFMSQVNACGDVAVIDSSGVGPYPLEHFRPRKPNEHSRH